MKIIILKIDENEKAHLFKPDDMKPMEAINLIAKALHTSMEELMGQMKDDPEKCYYRVQQEIYQFKDSWSDQQKLNLIAILSTFLKSPAGRN